VDDSCSEQKQEHGGQEQEQAGDTADEQEHGGQEQEHGGQEQEHGGQEQGLEQAGNAAEEQEQAGYTSGEQLEQLEQLVLWEQHFLCPAASVSSNNRVHGLLWCREHTVQCCSPVPKQRPLLEMQGEQA